MANFTELDQYDEYIYQLDTQDPVLGGPDGTSNKQGKALANRTNWLKLRLAELTTAYTNFTQSVAQSFSQIYTKSELYTKTETDNIVNTAKSDVISTAASDATAKVSALAAKTKSGLKLTVEGAVLTTITHNLNIPIDSQNIQLTIYSGSGVSGGSAYQATVNANLSVCNLTANSFDIMLGLENQFRNVFWQIHDLR